MKKIMLECVGTSNDKLVYKGVYRFYETIGLPLDVLFECMAQKKAMVSWIDFYQEAISAGMSHSRILSKLEEAICDVWGTDFYSVVKHNLNVLENKGK